MWVSGHQILVSPPAWAHFVSHLSLSHCWRCLEWGMSGCLPLLEKSYLLSPSWETEWRPQRAGVPFSKVPPANNQPYLLENMRKQNSKLPFIFSLRHVA